MAARAEDVGLAATADAKQVGRPRPGMVDENVEGWRDLGEKELRDLARANRPLPTAIERRLLQDAVDDVSTRLMHEPVEAARFLSKAEHQAVTEHPGLTNAYFGNVVERAVALELSDSPALSRFLHTPQRPGVSTPDIGGPIGRSGPRAFDITTSTDAARAAHQARPYAPFTTLVTYPPLPLGWRFPPPG